ncbi:hypothetical protein AALP_AA3G181500 [Arabis alpina]|uniref:Uncharacterized protein n=1 Tax=Arabis alpina TaxID=50452 RepID=A0A087HA01_ARAAL|nr:hypothetical protein AALP_AA3G181500 [Arabis alpina]
MKHSPNLRFFSITLFGIVTQASPEGKVKAVPFFSSFFEEPVKRLARESARVVSLCSARVVSGLARETSGTAAGTAFTVVGTRSGVTFTNDSARSEGKGAERAGKGRFGGDYELKPSETT